ncbi:O-antigen ligase family protein [Candidatus Rariloculus sp.]|uniref:O-antigen ligase family protein n=1 Tax=Candidatus Rariloculus sp. TaxID=3101265 RepID=UPI003D0F2353
MRTPAWETWLRFGVLAGIGLVLLTPFVFSPGTIFPFVVGKAVWSRSVIEGVFALWAVLALADPAYRPPRSWVLVALAAGLAVSLLAACFGASFQRSLWSTYERMQGVVDGAHWMALAVVLVSVLRTDAAWRRLLMASAGAGTAMACLVIARHYDLAVPFFGTAPEQHLPRMSGPLGNPVYLSVYLLGNLMLAMGLAVRAWLTPAPPAASAAAAKARTGRRRGAKRRETARAWRRRGARRRETALPKRDGRAAPRRPAGLAWAVAAGLQLWGLALAGSVGGFAGLFAALAFVAVATALLARRRARRIAALALAGLAVLAVGAGIRFVHPDRTALPAIEQPVARYVADVHLQRPGVQSRLAAWEAGLEGFAARPVLGWGPENFVAVFGRFASGYGAVTQPHDQAHGKLVEVAATTGAAGAAAYLGLWALALLAVWRAARRMGAGDRALALGAGAALAGTLAQSQFQFDTPAGSLQGIVLLGFAAGLEARAFGDSHRPRLPARLSARCAALLRGRRARIALGAAAVALAVGGLTVHQRIHAAADVGHLPGRQGSLSVMAGGIEGFRPLANTWRWVLFNVLGQNWPGLRAENGPGARDLLDWASREAAEVVRTEPHSWRIQQSVARMYRAAAATDPEYAPAARRYLERARALAPNRAVFPAALHPPDGLASSRLDDGRHELRWRWPEGAGYLAVGESRGDGAWRFILHVYDAAQTSFVLPGGRAPGAWRYRVKACRFPGQCSALVEWPAPAPPADENGLDGAGEPQR